jgi:undecaprenyl-diphosphatase
MIDFLDGYDKQLLLWLNGFHNSFWDTIMWWASSAPFWIPFYIILLIILIKDKKSNIRIETFKRISFIIGSIAVAILLADQISSGFFKPFFERLRPSHTPDLLGQVHLLADPNGSIYKGGLYGFVSSHAANSFAIAWFVSALLKSKRTWIIMIFWASIVSYSRIYLGVHYPGDILGGAIIGILSGWIAASLYFYLKKKWSKTNSTILKEIDLN